MMKPFLTLALVMIALPAFAFNPRSIPRHQQNAPEQLEIEVTQIEEKKVTRGEMRFLSIEAKAKVSKVTESASGVEKGDTITVSWLIPLDEGAIGGGWPGKIKKGSYLAYLRADGKAGHRYLPAAYTGSFVADKKRKTP